MVQALHYLKESPSQTAGPYVHIGLTPNYCGINGVYSQDLGKTMVNDETKGQRIKVVGKVFDGTGTVLKDAVIEIWQADHAGLYNSPSELRGVADQNFRGWGRCPADGETGEFRFDTIKPGAVPFKDGRMMAPHISFWIVARGINVGLNTRMYFPEEEQMNSSDPILARIEHRSRVASLIAQKEDDNTYRFDIYLQGEKETVFLDV